MAKGEKKKKAPPRKQKGQKCRDYGPLRTAYVEGIVDGDGNRRWPTYQEVAELFNFPASLLRAFGAREKWTDAKGKFRADLEQAAREKTINRLSNEAAELDSAALKCAKAGIAECARHLAAMGKRRKLEEDATYPERDLEALGRALAGFHKTGRLALGEPTESTENRNLETFERMPADLRRRKINEMLDRWPKEDLCKA
ncbi:MAG: hypothetical protein KQJ78_07605 [Deltaproteobacteria bacterium]|nr:hypothetical protein [Deltaproteobacteria bacterium]